MESFLLPNGPQLGKRTSFEKFTFGGMVKMKLRIFASIFLSLSLASVLAAGPVSATTHERLAESESNTQPAVPAAGTQGIQQVVATCLSGYYGYGSYAILADYLRYTKGWYLNSKNVWQSPNDNETWTLYCQITSSAAYMYISGSNLYVSPSPVYLGDGTRIDYRTTSSSGGYTIDINNNGTIYKVHRQ
jgi:hypothetical protein